MGTVDEWHRSTFLWIGNILWLFPSFDESPTKMSSDKIFNYFNQDSSNHFADLSKLDDGSFEFNGFLCRFEHFMQYLFSDMLYPFLSSGIVIRRG